VRPPAPSSWAGFCCLTTTPCRPRLRNGSSSGKSGRDLRGILRRQSLDHSRGCDTPSALSGMFTVGDLKGDGKLDLAVCSGGASPAIGELSLPLGPNAITGSLKIGEECLCFTPPQVRLYLCDPTIAFGPGPRFQLLIGVAYPPARLHHFRDLGVRRLNDTPGGQFKGSPAVVRSSIQSW
jgi:hypothetical protein